MGNEKSVEFVCNKELVESAVVGAELSSEEAVADGELSAKDTPKLEEHKVFDEMSDSKFRSFTVEEDDYSVHKTHLSGKGLIQLFETNMEVNLLDTSLRDKWCDNFSKKPKMKRKSRESYCEVPPPPNEG